MYNTYLYSNHQAFESFLKRNMELLRNKMNTGISPYYWCLYKEFDGYIEGIHYKADYVISLEKPDTPTFW